MVRRRRVLKLDHVSRPRAVAAALLLSFAAPNVAFAQEPPPMVLTRPPDVREMLKPRLLEAQSFVRTETPLTAFAAGPKDIGVVKTIVVLALVIVVVVVVGGVILIANAAD
jgi:hypothetical protein